MTVTAAHNSAYARSHVYRPRGAALQLLHCRQPEVLLAGPAGTGKTRACLEKLLAACLITAGVRALIVRKTGATLGGTTLATWRMSVAKEALSVGDVEFYGGSRQEPPCYRFGNGSVIALAGMDNPTKIMSSDFDIVYVGEATELRIGDWEALTTRLRHGLLSYQQIIADCNPDRPDHWLNLRCQAGTTHKIESRHEDNPLLYDEQGNLTEMGAPYIAKLDRLTGVRYLRLRKGIWASAEGLVYDRFDPAVHVTDEYGRNRPPPARWTRYLAVDFGYTNPFVAQWWAIDPDGRAWQYREIYRTGTLVEDHARRIKELHGDEPPFSSIVCDHDAEDRATLERHLGYSTTAANKNVTDGIQAVQERLRMAGDGRPRVMLCRDAVADRDETLVQAGKPASTVDEIPGYVWDTRSQPGSGNVREHPRKENDHGADAMRYLVAHLDVTGSPRVRWFYT